jgi:hypothetical protein
MVLAIPWKGNMRKSKDGSGRSDGRKHNVPPEHGKIKPGEIRNKWGRAGKPRPQPPTTMDELLWQEAGRIVSHDGDGPVDAKKRLIQEEFVAALRDGDSSVRARLLGQLHDTGARIDREQREILEFFYEAKVCLTERFYFAKKCGTAPPDVVPHPAHVEIAESRVHFRGPADRPGRAAWETIKAAIRVAASLHEIVRNEYRRTGSQAVFVELKAIEKHRRWLMRSVPKGWNWQEDIYCLDSELDPAKDIVSKLKEIGYVASDACD